MRPPLLTALSIALALSNVVSSAAESYAVVIGIRDYKNFHTEQPLNYPDKDAEKFYNLLRNKESGAFTRGNMTLLPNGKATRSGITSAINWLAKVAKKRDDVAYVYFSGHGALDKADRVYLMPADGDAGIPEDKGWEAEDFLRLLEAKVSAGHLIVFVDACYAGAVAKGRKGAARTAAPDLQVLWKQAFRHSEATHFAFLSATGDQRSWEDPDLGGGIFTHFLIQGLQGMADLPPYGNHDGKVTAGELYKYVRDQVSAHTRLKFKLQTPTISEGFDESWLMAAPGGSNLTVTTEAASPSPAWEGPIFPLLPDPPEDAWPPGDRGQEARIDLIKAKGFIERTDILCSAAPSFGQFSRSEGFSAIVKADAKDSGVDHAWFRATGDNQLSLYSKKRYANPGDAWARPAFDAADSSLDFGESPWARLYRGLALARLRAFDAAQLDLDRAVDDFRSRGMKRYADVSSRLRTLAHDWQREPAHDSPPPSSRPGCAAASGRTICELAGRVQWPTLSQEEQRALIERFKFLIESPICRAGTECVPLTPKADVQCANVLAWGTDAGLAAEIHAGALQHALRNGLTAEAEVQAANLALTLIEAGRSDEADRVIRQRRDLWSPYRRAWISLRAALQPVQPAGSLEAKVSLLEIEPALKADLIALRANSREIRIRLGRIGAALEAMSPEEIQQVDRLAQVAASAGMGFQPVDEVALLLDKVRSAVGAEVYDGLQPLVDGFLATLDRIAKHTDGPLELGNGRAELGDGLDALRDTCAALAGSENGKKLVAGLALAVASFSSYDVALRRRGEPDWLVGLNALLDADQPKEIEPYRASFAFASSIIRKLAEEKGIQSLQRSLLFKSATVSSSGASEDSMEKALAEARGCFEKKLDQPAFLECLRQSVWRWFEAMAMDKEVGDFAPLAKAHQLVKVDLLPKVGSVPTSEENWTLYTHGLAERLIDSYYSAGELTAPQHDLLGVIIPFFGFLSNDSSWLIDRLAQAQSDNPGMSDDVPRELLILLGLVSPSRNEAAGVPSRRAQAALGELRHPFYRAFVLGLPATYAGLPPDAIRTLIRLSGLEPTARGPGLLEIALWVALLLDQEHGVLHYDQKTVLASFLLKQEDRVDTFVSIPIGQRFVRFATKVSPLVFPSTCNNTELEPRLSFTDAEGLGGQVLCSCCAWAPGVVHVLLAQALDEKLWDESARWFSWLKERRDAHPDLHFGIGPAASLILETGPGVPADLRLSAAGELQALAKDSALDLEERIEITYSLTAAFASDPEGSLGIARNAVRDLIAMAGRRLAQSPLGSKDVPLTAWFDYLDGIGKAFEGLKDPELLSLWKAQTTRVRGSLAASPWPAADGTEAVSDDETAVAQAIHKLDERAAKGDARAMVHLGWIRCHTFGSGHDDAKALALFERAAKLGDREAMQHLASLLPPEANGAAKAVAWLQKSAALGNAEALTDLGRLYLEGRVVRRDPRAAYEWFRKAADQGSADGMNELGIAYAMGVGTPADPRTAATWFQRADKLGHPAALANLVALFPNGLTQP